MPQRFVSILTLAAVAAAAAVTTSSSALGQTPKPTLEKRRPAPLLPMAPGATWKWRLTIDQRQPVEVSWRCVQQLPLKKPKRKQSDAAFWADELRDRQPEHNLAWEIRVLHGTETRWEYWAERRDGIFKLKNRFLGDMRGVSPDQPTRLIPGPLGISAAWRWTEIGSMQTEGRAGYPSAAERTMEFVGKLQSMSEPVTVPAGTFDAVRVRIQRTSELFGNTVETLWLTRGVGIVKRRLYLAHGDHTHLYELTGFQPGTAVVGTVRQRIQKLLRQDPDCAARGKPQSLRPVPDPTVETHLGSRFFAARWEGATVFFRDHEGRTSIFHPGRSASWQRLIREELGTARRTDGIAITRCFGVLWAHFRIPGRRPVPIASELSVRKEGNFDVLATIEVSDAAGKRVERWARMWFRDGTVSRLESDVGEPRDNRESTRRAP